MTGFLAGLGAKLAERWAALLVLPCLIYVSAMTSGLVLGHRHALDSARLTAWIDDMATRHTASNAGVILLVAAGVLSASAVAGLLASALGNTLEWSWHRPEQGSLSRALTRRRQARWRAEDARFARELAAAAASVVSPAVRGRTPQLPPGAATALIRRNAVALEPPVGPTWIGDRFRALTRRVHRAYALNLHAAWPSLWLLLPDQPRAEISAGRDAHSAAARLGGWAVLYFLLGTLWWPALPAAVLLFAIAWYRARVTAAVLAELLEAAVDLYIRDLAAHLGLTPDDPLTTRTGQAITDLLEKSSEVGPRP
ncbi:MAG: hypothetical protein HOV68_05935 [Streptomycetaceae bacterium]|nr:hypothetical protein [Streptomycetaceae bacterium]